MPTVCTVAQFKAEFGQFAQTDADLVARKLDAAERRCDATAFGDLHADAVKNLAAHLITIDPKGGAARLQSQSADSTYNQEYKRLVALAGPAQCRIL